MKKTICEELLEAIENTENGDGVRCLLESIYGENKGNKLFRVWCSGNESKLKRMIEREEA